MKSETILSALCQVTQLKALFLYYIPNGSYEQLLTELPNFSNLQEIELKDYSLLPTLSNLSNLTYLKISRSFRTSEQFPCLLQLIQSTPLNWDTFVSGLLSQLTKILYKVSI